MKKSSFQELTFKNAAIKLTIPNPTLQRSAIFVALGKPTQEVPPRILRKWLFRALATSKLNSETGFSLMPVAPCLKEGF